MALGGLGYIRQAELLLFQRCQVRSEDYAARVARPRVEVLRGIVLLKERISGIAEYAFDKVEIAHERARRKEAYLHRFFGLAVGYFGANRRAQVYRDPSFRLTLLRGSERELEHFVGGGKCARPQIFKNALRHGFFIGRNRKPAFGDVEDAGSRAPIAARIIQYALPHPVRRNERIFMFVAIRGQREGSRGSKPVENKSLVRERRERFAGIANVA